MRRAVHVRGTDCRIFCSFNFQSVLDDFARYMSFSTVTPRSASLTVGCSARSLSILAGAGGRARLDHYPLPRWKFRLWPRRLDLAWKTTNEFGTRGGDAARHRWSS
jgi:hypothetical protein